MTDSESKALWLALGKMQKDHAELLKKFKLSLSLANERYGEQKEYNEKITELQRWLTIFEDKTNIKIANLEDKLK